MNGVFKACVAVLGIGLLSIVSPGQAALASDPQPGKWNRASLSLE
jgi:hypothetical protein